MLSYWRLFVLASPVMAGVFISMSAFPSLNFLSSQEKATETVSLVNVTSA
jgi:hypothetical protein